MNPADVAQSVLPLTSSDLSLFTLFWHAHWIVKAVMIGLLVCSVWVWAIAIDKTVLYTHLPSTSTLTVPYHLHHNHPPTNQPTLSPHNRPTPPHPPPPPPPP